MLSVIIRHNIIKNLDMADYAHPLFRHKFSIAQAMADYESSRLPTVAGRNRPSPQQRTVTAITVAIRASALNKEWLGRCGGRTSCLVCS